MGGILGCMFTAIFADNDVVTMSGGEPIAGTRWQNVNYPIIFNFMNK